MYKTIVPAVVTASLAVSTLALASEVSTGKITAIDAQKHTLKLDDGVVYRLPDSLKTNKLKTGETVTITWNLQDGSPIASTVTPSSF